MREALEHYTVVIAPPRDTGAHSDAQRTSGATNHQSVSSDEIMFRVRLVKLLAEHRSVSGVKMAIEGLRNNAVNVQSHVKHETSANQSAGISQSVRKQLALGI